MLFRIYVKAYIITVMITPNSLFGIFSDSTRLRALMLIQSEGEACVCELTFALQESQPKISRHLALMRGYGYCRVTSRRDLDALSAQPLSPGMVKGNYRAGT